MPLTEVLSLLLYVNALVVIVILIYEERDPSTTLAWTMALMLFPVFGLVAYLLFGRNWRLIGKRDRRRIEASRLGDEAMRPVYERWSERARAAMAARRPALRRLSAAIERQSKTQVLPCVEFELFPSGAEKFARLLDDIEAANDSVHLEYFIWEEDELTGRVCELLARKARAGVAVHVMYDWVGSLPYGKRQLRALKAAGAEVHADAAHWVKLNYRNHRKIVVVDGQIAYTGGMNMGAEYIDGGARYDSWRDTHCRFEGPLVADLQRLFCERWYRVTGDSLFEGRYFPDLELGGRHAVWAQLGYSGPESDFQALRNAFLLAIGPAEQRVHVQSPYFVPDESILEALVTQSLAGVDVRFMMTGVPDKPIAWNAAFSYTDELIEAGGRVHHYRAGFFHPKAMTVDDDLAVIGTTNFDIRSFLLHDELSIFFFDADIVARQEAIFAADMRLCEEITLATYKGFSRVRRFRNALARLWSRML